MYTIPGLKLLAVLPAGIGLLVLLGWIIPVQGVGITVEPLSISEGDMVTVHIQDLPDGTLFSFGLEGTFHTSPGETFIFRANPLVMPFTLHEGIIAVYSEHTSWTRVTVKKENSTAGMKGESVDGIFQTNQSHNITAGTIDDLVIDGETLPDQGTVIFRIMLSGVKSGPDTSEIAFTVRGAEEGTVKVLAVADGSQILYQQLTILPSEDGTGGMASQEGPSGTAGTVPPPSTEIIPTSHPEAGVQHSEDYRVRVFGTGNCSILRLQRDSFPSKWDFVMEPYSVRGDNITGTLPGTLVFNLSGIDQDDVLFLAVWEGTEWRMLPSRIEGETIRADISATGIYGLFTVKKPMSDSLTNPEAPLNPDPSRTTAGTQTPISLGPVIAGIFGGIVLLAWRKWKGK